jgi:hypothetical protein
MLGRYPQPPQDRYDVAQVCPNGHVANEHVEMHSQHNKEFCEACGEKTITACPKCNAPLRGAYTGTLGFYKAPAFCNKCGAAFPWTERRQQAALDLFIDATNPTKDETTQFAESLNAVARDTPSATVAAGRLSRFLKKAGAQVGGAIKDLIVQFACAAAVKVLMP